MAPGTFDLILCRNLVLTYFEESFQPRLLAEITRRLRPGGAFVIGKSERLPAGVSSLKPWFPTLGLYRRET